AGNGSEAPAGWRRPPACTAPRGGRRVKRGRAGDETTVRFEVAPPAGARDAVTAMPALRVDGKSWSYRQDAIDYPHIPPQLVVTPATVRVVPLGIKIPSGLVGYIRGSGGSVAEDLAHIGLHVADIDADGLRTGDLGRFAAIVVGIRALNVRADVRAAHDRLMAYVERGGVLVVQYNTSSRFAPLEGP